jgi:hypothetical protein|tara:strand:+ start:2427 stop:2657 length:231 start_codon:yes stop_codon:yes gene_type:complete
MRLRARHLHLAESLANVIIGYFINLVLIHVLLHWLGYPIQLNENAKMGAIVVAVSFARGYCLRRAFNRIVGRVYAQ